MKPCVFCSGFCSFMLMYLIGMVSLNATAKILCNPFARLMPRYSRLCVLISNP